MSGILATAATAGSQAAYNPVLDSTVIEWLKADAISLADGASITTWTASIGVSATQSISAQRPIFKTNIKNALPVVRTDGISQTLAFAYTNTSQPTQIFIVMKTTSTGSKVLFETSASGNALFTQQFSINGTNFVFSAGGAGCVLVSINASFHVFFLEANAGISRTKTDGGSINSCNAGPTGYAGLILGAGHGPSFFSQCDFGEIIVRNTIGDPNPVMNYLNGRWAVY